LAARNAESEAEKLEHEIRLPASIVVLGIGIRSKFDGERLMVPTNEGGAFSRQTAGLAISGTMTKINLREARHAVC
jgi:hypothetical protein